MKGKIGTFLIGLLVGAIITTAGFLIYNKGNRPDMEQTNSTRQKGGRLPDDMEGEPPEKPDGDDGQEPPEKPDEERQENSSESTSNT